MKKNKEINKITKNKATEQGNSATSIQSQLYIRELISLLTILVLGIAIYSNSFDCSFQFDDDINILKNTEIRDLYDIHAIWNYNHLRFLPFVSFAINYHFGEFDVWGYHFVNLIIHIINAVLVWRFTLLIFSTPKLKNEKIAKHGNTIAFFTALLFLSHPLATQSVTYIVQRMASMVAMFYFLTLFLYVKSRLCSQNNLQKYLFLFGAFLSGILAILSKENSFTLPLTIILIEAFFLQAGTLTSILKEKKVYLFVLITVFLSAIIFSIHSTKIFDPIPPYGGRDLVVTPLNYFLTQFHVIVTYIRLLFLPINQNLDYDLLPSENLLSPLILWSLLLLLSIIFIAVISYKKNRIISFGIFWFFITLSVESGIIPIADLIYEHRTYLPSFGFFLLLSVFLAKMLLNNYKILFYLFFTCIIIGNSVLTYNRNKVWKDDLTLWNDVVSKSPNLARAYLNLGSAYFNRNELDKAIDNCNRAIELNPKSLPMAYFYCGLAHDKLYQWDRSVVNYSKSIEINPEFYQSYANRAIAYANLNELDKAIADFSIIIKKDPINARNLFNRGNAYMNLKQWKESITDFSRAIEIDPKYTDAYCNRAIVSGNLNEPEKAISDFSKIIEIDPKFIKAYKNRAITFSNLKKWKEAINDYSTVIKFLPNDKSTYYDRGFTYINTEEWNLAIADFSKVLEMDPNNQSANSAREFAYKKIRK